MNTIVPGSLADLMRQNNTSIAESFLNVDVIVIVDVSGSMNTPDARGNQKRYEVACQELAKLQRDIPGKIAIVAFSDRAEFVPGGIPPYIGAGTNLAGALQFVKVADGLVKFIVISDGQPDDDTKALTIARQFKSKIDVVYVGPEDDFGGGRRFLEKLAAASGGQFTTSDRAHELADKVERLLLTT